MKTRHWDRIGNGGVTFTELGFGSAPLGNIYQPITEAQAQATLDAAWETGVRYLDTAPLYGLGLAETRYNHFLRGKPREDYILSTKIGRLLKACAPEDRTGIGMFFDTPNRREVFDYTYDGVMRSLEDSLERLGVDSVDILFAHDLCIFTHGSKAESDRRIDQFMLSGYDAMIRLRDEGVVKAIGAGVNEWQVCQTLAERGDMDLFLLAGRYTLLEQEALDCFLPLCEARGIGIVLGGPYNSGILATGPVEGATYNYTPAAPDVLDRVGRIEKICLAHGTPLIAAALQFPLHHPSVVSVIPGAQSADQARANLKVFETPIPDALWSDLKSEGLLRQDAPIPG